jgi:hypothetical protein
VNLKYFWIGLLLISLVSCYRMPTEEEYSVIPTINNPDVTREKRGLPVPGVKY